ncbi:MAG: Lpg1974 family pore-forming outer membrane protein [Simkaniaceae bacterium]|nr:Lpg1974 family pore-forming outer membrane protein [Candidatus Sacchlamyda saccharinae]
MRFGAIFAAVFLSTSLLRAETEVFADFLVWCTNEASSENWGQVFTTEGSTENIDLLSVSFGCDYGFRVGLDYVTCHDCWDLLGAYTWYRSNGKDSTSTDGLISSAFLANFYIDNADGTKLAGPTYRRASMRWQIDFNIFDAELGRLFCASECLTLRPFIGLKGGWIDQSIDTSWQNPTDPALLFTRATEDLKNDFWGIGPSAGLNLDWILCSGECYTFSLFNDLSGALMYGHWTFQDRYQNDRAEEVVIDLSNIDGAAPMIRNFIGLSWRRSSFAVRLGYEAQVWLSQLQLYTLNGGRLNNVLTLQGGSLDVRFAF